MMDKIQEAIEYTWSDYSDLDYWITEMSSKDGVPTKWVLKMAMKHLRRDMYAVHGLLIELKDERETRVYDEA